MSVKMIVTALCLFFALAKASMVELNSEWTPNFGWQVLCSWTLYANDSLQSVRLYKTDQQFMIYRPERDGEKRSTLVRLSNMEFHVDCYEITVNGITGKCIMSLEILQPVTEDINYTCEVSGERPTFRVESKTVNIEALVPPSKAIVEKITHDQSTGRVSVNCSSTGLPPPTLVWTIGDQKLPSDFSNGAWNFTSKLYHVWSSLSYTPDGNSHPVCTPEIFRGGQLVKGLQAQYSAATFKRGAADVILAILTILAFTR